MTNYDRGTGSTLALFLLVAGLCFLIFGGSLMFLDGDFPIFFLDGGILLSVAGSVTGFFSLWIQTKRPRHAHNSDPD